MSIGILRESLPGKPHCHTESVLVSREGWCLLFTLPASLLLGSKMTCRSLSSYSVCIFPWGVHSFLLIPPCSFPMKAT